MSLFHINIAPQAMKIIDTSKPFRMASLYRLKKGRKKNEINNVNDETKIICHAESGTCKYH
jgi:hypothetical protein